MKINKNILMVILLSSIGLFTMNEAHAAAVGCPAGWCAANCATSCTASNFCYPPGGSSWGSTCSVGFCNTCACPFPCSGSGTGDIPPGGPGPAPGPGPISVSPGIGISPGPGPIVISPGPAPAPGPIFVSPGPAPGPVIISPGPFFPSPPTPGPAPGPAPAPAPTYTCHPPEYDTGSACAFSAAKNACDNGAGGGPPSVTNLKTSGVTTGTDFDNTVNKKLACCLNTRNSSTDATTKYDCMDNAGTAVGADFNTMWAKSDDNISGLSSTGNQMFATILTNAAGMPTTGFFSLNGARCKEFSEFGASAPIQPMKVNPTIMATQQTKVAGGAAFTPVGTPIPIPTAPGYAYIKGKILKGIPTTQADMLRCPILVRAFIVTSCPADSAPPIVHTAYPYGATKTTYPRRCAAAESITAHVRMEQIYEIMGSPKQKTIDSVQDALNRPVSTDLILGQKNGDACETGSTLHGTQCWYN